MNRVEQKRKARHVLSKAARHDRFISLYVMKKNKDVYAEAKKFYDDLDKKYPFKRDLTKTGEFVHEITGYTSVYLSGQAIHHAKKQETKDMSLEIPLMDKGDVDIAVIAQKVDESLAIPDHIYNNLLAEISKDPAMSSIFNNINQEQPISKDPAMSSIFNNINQEQPQEIDEQQQELSQILDELDDILPQESSPLEQELEQLICE